MSDFHKCREALLQGPDLLGACVMMLCVPLGGLTIAGLAWVFSLVIG